VVTTEIGQLNNGQLYLCVYCQNYRKYYSSIFNGRLEAKPPLFVGDISSWLVIIGYSMYCICICYIVLDSTLKRNQL